MSQKKVNQYKEYKKNRTQILKREKMMNRIELTAAAVIAAVFVGWLGWSVYHNVTRASEEAANAPAALQMIELTDYSNYLNTLPNTFTA